LGKGSGEGTGSGAYAGAGSRVNNNDRIVQAEIRAAEAEKRYVGHVWPLGTLQCLCDSNFGEVPQNNAIEVNMHTR
jgi:hypothetical protein